MEGEEGLANQCTQVKKSSVNEACWLRSSKIEIGANRCPLSEVHQAIHRRTAEPTPAYAYFIWCFSCLRPLGAHPNSWTFRALPIAKSRDAEALAKSAVGRFGFWS